MNFFTRLFKRKPKGINNVELVQYLHFQTQQLQLLHFQLYQKKITKEDYIIAVDEVICQMRREIYSEPPDWIQPVDVSKKLKRRRLKKE